jgi:hypothetical protein
MTMSSQVAYDPANFFVWRASDGFAIHLSLKVVTQLATYIARAGSDNAPAETRGILLGRTVDTPFRTTVIEDFKLVPSSEDPAVHSDSRDTLLEIACRMVEAGNEQRVVGFFGAQRDGKLNMGPRDLETFSRLFCETGNVALLIQTPRRGTESEAALFFWQHGGAYPRDFGFGFPLDAAQLASGHPGWRYPDPLAAAAPVPEPPPPPPLPKAPQPEPQWMPPPPVSVSSEGIRWSRLMPTVALVAIAIGTLELVTNSNRTVEAAPASAEASASPTAPASLGLAVTSRPHQLEIRWNRESAAITDSEHGVMKITEGGATQEVPFDQRQLRDGYVAYTPRTSDVSINFEVTGKDGATTSESMRSVAIP